MKRAVLVGPSVFAAVWAGSETCVECPGAEVGDVLRVVERWPQGDVREVLGQVESVSAGRATFAPDTRVEWDRATDRQVVWGFQK